MRRLRMFVYWSLPALACLALYSPGLRAWFQQDDFAWLALGGSVKDVNSLLHALFAPMAQGTIRPLSERAFFMVFYEAFGLWATPFRVFVFITQFANLVLLGLLAERVSRSRLIGFLAAVFWALNGGLAGVMSWTSAYNQVACGFFLLLALYCFVLYTETGEKRYLAAQWAAFLLGFGALELNAVYPALAAAYALCCARPYLRKTWPMFGVSAAYTALHFWAAPLRSANPAYVMHFDGSIFQTLWTYWVWTLGPARLPHLAGLAPWVGGAGTVLLTVGLVGFAAWKVKGKEWRAALPLFWFMLVLLPVLPLRDHISDYYLTLPAAGVAWLLAEAVAAAFGSGRYLKLPAAVLASIYLVAGIVGGRIETARVVARSHDVRTLVWGAVRVRQLHPGKTIILTGLKSDVFWAGVFPRPFGLVGVSDIYVAPEAERQVEPHPERGRVSDYVLPPGILLELLSRDQAVVYKEDAGRLKALTLSYTVSARRRWKTEQPRRVDVGQASFSGQLGPTWYELDSGHRWMPRRASVTLGGPRTPLERLYVAGYCPAAQTRSGLLRVTIEADGIPLGTWPLTNGDAAFELAAKFPPQFVGKEAVEISVAVDRTFTSPPDRRDLGLVFGTFEIRLNGKDR